MRIFLRFVQAAAMLAASSLAVARAQSLADIARQEEARRKTVKDGGKVYTNKDLKPVPPPSPSEPQPPAAPAGSTKTADKESASSAKGKEKEKEAEPEPVKDQKYWSGRMRDRQAQLDRDQVYADALQSRVNQLTADFVNRDDPAQRAVIGTDRQKAVAELDRVTQAIQEDKKAIADLEEEARRAGVPPGWLRQ